MSNQTIRLPDDKYEQLKALAEARKISVNKLIDELATVALANHDARLWFETRARRGSDRKALDVLNALGRRINGYRRVMRIECGNVAMIYPRAIQG